MPLHPVLEQAIRSMQQPSFASPYPTMEGVSPEEAMFVGMPDLAKVMLQREQLSNQRLGPHVGYNTELGEMAQRSAFGDQQNELGQNRIGADIMQALLQHQQSGRFADIQQQNVGLRGQEIQQRGELGRAELGMRGQEMQQRGQLGQGELQQQFIRSLLEDAYRREALGMTGTNAMANLIQAQGSSAEHMARARGYDAQFGGMAPGGQGSPAQATQGGDDTAGGWGPAIMAGVLAAYLGLGKGKIPTGARGMIGKAFGRGGAAAPEAASAAAPMAGGHIGMGPMGPAQQAASPVEELLAAIEPQPTGGFSMGAGETTVAPVWMRGAQQPAMPINELLEQAMTARQSMGPRAPMGSGPHQFSPPAVIGGGPMALPEEAKQLLVAKILQSALAEGKFTDPHVAQWLSRFAQ